MCSFLPKDESDRRNLSRQGEASHRWLHAFREQALVEVVERSLLAAGHTRRTLEDRFHVMIVILIEPTQLLWFLGTLQLSSQRNGMARCRASQSRDRCRSTVVAWCGNDEGFG